MIKLSSSYVPFLIDGPARGIFVRKLDEPRRHGRVETVAQLLNECEWLLCSASWQGRLEWDTALRFQAQGRKVVVLLDHWINYRSRLTRFDRMIEPDTIWVLDSSAAQMAKTIFSAIPVVVIGNPYLEEVVTEVKESASLASRSRTVLYLGENVTGHSSSPSGPETPFGYTEADAFRYFLYYVQRWKPRVDRIIVRPHPSETGEHYRAWARVPEIPIEFSSGSTLTEDIVASQIVVGCESMAMVAALFAGRRVWSAIPPGGKISSLPFPQIRPLEESAQHQEAYRIDLRPK